MEKLFTLSEATRQQYEVDEWLSSEPDSLFSIARYWFKKIRLCGDDVSERLHDGHPVACVGDAAFAYVDVFSRHLNIGFFTGAMLPDPDCLLEGTGKRMRHIKIRPGEKYPTAAIEKIIGSAYYDMKIRVARREQI